jgi:hypothetical protein
MISFIKDNVLSCCISLLPYFMWLSIVNDSDFKYTALLRLDSLLGLSFRVSNILMSIGLFVCVM